MPAASLPQARNWPYEWSDQPFFVRFNRADGMGPGAAGFPMASPAFAFAAHERIQVVIAQRKRSPMPLRKLANDLLHERDNEPARSARAEKREYERSIVSLFFVLRALVEGRRLEHGKIW